MTLRVDGTLPAAETDDLLRALAECRRSPAPDDGTLAARLLAALEADESCHAGFVRALCGLATDADPRVRQRGQDLLFPGIAEPLGDAFSRGAVTVHDSVFAHAIDVCRSLPAGARLDAQLIRFGIRDRQDLLARRSTQAVPRPMTPESRARIRKVFVLSRITLGADVAVTSALLQVVQRTFPDADRVLVGPSGSGQLLAGLAGTRAVEQPYDRSGLLERLRSWLAVTEVLEGQTAGLSDEEWLVVDPDSRLTQLGLLPVARPTVPYLFFESRGYSQPSLETLGELAPQWLTRALGVPADPDARPRVTLSSVDIGRAQSLVQAIGGGKPSFVVTANLGVGGNPRKRVPGDFELHLIRSLLDEGSRVILDHGAGEDESRVEAIVSTLRSEGRRIGDISGTDFSTTALSGGCDLLAYRGGVAPFAALAGAGDLYVGYDSAFQHIAAALGTPVVDVFVNPPNAIFPRRWKPHSVAPVTVIEVTDDAPDLVARIADVHRLFRQSTASR